MSIFDEHTINSNIIVKSRAAATMAIGVAQLALCVLGLTAHLTITVDSKYQALTLLNNDKFWAGAFLVTGAMVLSSIGSASLKQKSMSFSASTLGVWGLIQFLYALTTVNPVSWVGPILSLVLAVISMALANAWAVVSWEKRIKEA